MKTVSGAVAARIEAAVFEGKTILAASVIEKDALVCELIDALARLPAHSLFEVVFCGGTCLSRAYRIIERMSEDVDFKIVFRDNGEAISKSRMRKELGQYANDVMETFARLGYPPESQQRRSRDSNNFTQLLLEYESAGNKAAVLRPHIQVELVHTTLAAPTVAKPHTSLIDAIDGGRVVDCETPIQCISLDEALVEKLVSFPRRLALFMKRHPDDTETCLGNDDLWDAALVRHLYDVHEITRKGGGLLSDATRLGEIFDKVVAKDAADFKNQHPSFIRDGANEMLAALDFASKSTTLRGQYADLMDGMVYATDAAARPDFDTAFSRYLSIFRSVARMASGPVPVAPTQGRSHRP